MELVTVKSKDLAAVALELAAVRSGVQALPAAVVTVQSKALAAVALEPAAVRSGVQALPAAVVVVVAVRSAELG